MCRYQQIFTQKKFGNQLTVPQRIQPLYDITQTLRTGQLRLINLSISSILWRMSFIINLNRRRRYGKASSPLCHFLLPILLCYLHFAQTLSYRKCLLLRYHSASRSIARFYVRECNGHPVSRAYGWGSGLIGSVLKNKPHQKQNCVIWVIYRITLPRWFLLRTNERHSSPSIAFACSKHSVHALRSLICSLDWMHTVSRPSERSLLYFAYIKCI